MSAATPGESVPTAVRRLLLARAAELARSGQYRLAEELLAAGGLEGASAAALDLLARSCAQQGRYDEAVELWQRAAQLEPDNRAYADGLRLARRSEGRPKWLYGFSRLMLVGVLLAAVALAGIALSGKRPAPAPRSGSIRDAAAATDAPIAPTINLGGDAIEVREDDRELVVTFRSGLFLSGARLTREGRAALASVAGQLEPHGNQILIRVIGHTDNTPPPAGYMYGDNTGLGYERARVAAERLRAGAGLPKEAIVLASGGDENPPYSNDTAEGRGRNRTVVLRISKPES